jgi:hypothetical protein
VKYIFLVVAYPSNFVLLAGISDIDTIIVSKVLLTTFIPTNSDYLCSICQFSDTKSVFTLPSPSKLQ